MNVRLITVSELKAHRRCKRLHRIRYVLGYRPVKDAPALRFGTLVHRGLEAWWDRLFDLIAKMRLCGIMPADRYDPALLLKEDRASVLAAALLAIAEEPDEYERAKAAAMLSAYHARWIGEAIEPLGVEVTLDEAPEHPGVPVVNPFTGQPEPRWRQGGKLDALVRRYRPDGTSAVYVMEHKTASGDVAPGSEYWQRLVGDSQVSIYLDGARALGFDAEGVIYDVLVKPPKPIDVACLDADGLKIVVDAAGERVRTKDGKKWRETASTADGYVAKSRPETPAEYGARLDLLVQPAPGEWLVRQEIARLVEALGEHRRDIYVEAQEIIAAPEHAPRNPDACHLYHRACEFWSCCYSGASLDDPALYRLAASAHEELAPAAAE